MRRLVLTILALLPGLYGFDTVHARSKNLSQSLDVAVTATPQSTHCGVTVSAVNKGDKPLVLLFNTAQQYDFYAKDENQRIVWKWSNDRVFADVQTKVTIQPGETFARSAKWQYARNDGHRVKAGKFQIMGAITPQPQDVYSKPVEIEVPQAPSAESNPSAG